MSMEPTAAVSAAAQSDIGLVRPLNQDRVFFSLEPVGVLPDLFVVADGMGGHKAGDLASSEAVRYFVDYIRQHSSEADDMVLLMKAALEITNRYIYYLSKESPDYEGMGTTFVACTLVGNKLYVINVGDSRLYVVNKAEGIRPMTLSQVTEDHSVVDMLLKKGLITEDEARVHPQKNMITRAIGIEEEVQVDHFELDTSNLLRILMCTDGLSNMLTDLELLSILTEATDKGLSNVQDTVNELIRRANEKGGKDNVTALVIDLGNQSEDSDKGSQVTQTETEKTGMKGEEDA
jgi:serine/threonine protein phosphatase PrpC